VGGWGGGGGGGGGGGEDKPDYIILLRCLWLDFSNIAALFFSGGMNGYIALCCGDLSPPVFRSPVDGLEDIMDNQVM